MVRGVLLGLQCGAKLLHTHDAVRVKKQNLHSGLICRTMCCHLTIMEVLVESASLRGVALIKLFMQLQGRLHGPQNHQSFYRVTKSSVCWVDLCFWRVCQEALRLLKTSVCMVAI